MTSPTPRMRLLKKVAGAPHRYARRRLWTQGSTIAVLLLVPLTGLARFDAWGGEHRLLGRPVDAVEGLVGIVVGIAVFYLVTFLINAVGGRLFCGWGCPVAQVTRFGEGVENATREKRRRVSAWLASAGYAALLSGSVVLWWVSPAVLLEGSLEAIGVVLGAWGVVTAAALAHGRWWRWGFCRRWCPIGLYYSVVSMETTLGIVFEERLGTCKDCGACETICPVGLDPLRLDAKRLGVGGLAIEGMPASHHCLRCGDCVVACEHIFRREDPGRVPLHYGLGRNGAPIEPRSPADVVVSPEGQGSVARPVTARKPAGASERSAALAAAAAAAARPRPEDPGSA